MPAARVARIVSTTPSMLTDLGFSLETVELMKPNGPTSRDRSIGCTRTPACPTTIGMPTATWIIGRQRALPAARSTTIPQSISWSSTPTHRPPRRTSVGWLVVL